MFTTPQLSYKNKETLLTTWVTGSPQQGDPDTNSPTGERGVQMEVMDVFGWRE